MKSITSFLLTMISVMLFSTALISQDDTKDKNMTWDEAKEEFHMVMASTFHPAEEGNLQPLKEDYAKLTAQAKSWSMIPVPKDLKGKGLEEKIKALIVDSTDLGKMINKGATDEEIKKGIYALHDIFHDIVGLCDH